MILRDFKNVAIVQERRVAHELLQSVAEKRQVLLILRRQEGAPLICIGLEVMSANQDPGQNHWLTGAETALTTQCDYYGIPSPRRMREAFGGAGKSGDIKYSHAPKVCYRAPHREHQCILPKLQLPTKLHHSIK